MYNRNLKLTEQSNGVNTVYVIEEERDTSPYGYRYSTPFSMAFRSLQHAKLFKVLWEGNKDNNYISVLQKEIVV